MFLDEDVVRICSKYTVEHPCRSVISIKLPCFKIILLSCCIYSSLLLWQYVMYLLVLTHFDLGFDFTNLPSLLWFFVKIYFFVSRLYSRFCAFKCLSITEVLIKLNHPLHFVSTLLNLDSQISQNSNVSENKIWYVNVSIVWIHP